MSIAAAEDEALAAQAPDWQREAIAMARLIDADAGTRFVPLPTRFDAHEPSRIGDPPAAGETVGAIIGARGAADAFVVAQDPVHEHGPWAAAHLRVVTPAWRSRLGI